MKQKERQKRFKIGLEYLQRTGLNLFIQSSFGRLSFAPGSFFENKEKEILTKPYSVRRLGEPSYTLNDEFRKRFQLTTEVDLQRLARACAILITDFNGPESDDTPEILFKRLRTYMRERSNRTGWEIKMALITLDDTILGNRLLKSESEYYYLAWILNVNYNLWKEREPFENFTVDDIVIDRKQS
ncbi:MAG TPA: hypothetical protein VMZ29_15620 [Candidatus Bathyarchaeia archaeon]|nr:hypothetical protein [Candidatus Bathyarchaeia archaeon]